MVTGSGETSAKRQDKIGGEEDSRVYAREPLQTLHLSSGNNTFLSHSIQYAKVKSCFSPLKNILPWQNLRYLG